MNSAAQTQAPNHWLKKFRKPSKNMFWTWIAYQTVKGTLTTSLIWIPLFWAWFH